MEVKPRKKKRLEKDAVPSNFDVCTIELEAGKEEVEPDKKRRLEEDGDPSKVCTQYTLPKGTNIFYSKLKLP